MTHLGEDGSFLEAADVGPGASSGDTSYGPSSAKFASSMTTRSEIPNRTRGLKQGRIREVWLEPTDLSWNTHRAFQRLPVPSTAIGGYRIGAREEIK